MPRLLNRVYKRYEAQAERELRVVKQAAGPSSDRAYEQVLARLGMQILQEQLPEIMQYFVGMSLLDRRDDGKFLAGFFIFNVGGAIVDIPMFLIDGKVKGYESLFLRDSKLFLPAESEVVEFILKQQKAKMGRGEIGEFEKRGRQTTMNVRPFSDQNRFLSKQAVFNSFASMLTAPESTALYDGTKRAELPCADITELLANRRVRGFVKFAAAQSPRLSRKLAAVLGTSWQEDLQAYEEAMAKTIKQAAMPKFDLSSDNVVSICLNPQPAYEHKFAAFTNTTAVTRLPRDQAVHELARYGAVFEDYRGPGSLKVAMKIEEVGGAFTSPLISGRYEVALSDGSTKKLLVFRPTDVWSLGHNDNSTLLLDPESGAVGLVSPTQLACRNNEQATKFAEKVDADLFGAAGMSTINGDTDYSGSPVVLVFPDGTVSSPTWLYGPNENSWQASSVYLRVQGDSASISIPRARKSADRVALDQTGSITKPRLVEAGDSAILRIPKDTKVFKLNDNNVPENVPTCAGGNTKEILVMPLTSLDVTSLKKEASFSLSKITDDYLQLNGKTVPVREVIAGLMANGIGKQAAMDIVDSQNGLKTHWAITDTAADILELLGGRKLAYDWRDDQYQFSEPSSPSAGQEGMHLPVRSENPVREAIPTTGMQWADTSAPPWSSENSPYSEAEVYGNEEKEEAQQLAEDPQYIFKNELFLSMVKHVNPAAERERLMTSLIKCCDGAGRARMLLLAHGQDFAEAYGIEDSDEMEEQLLTLIETGGKILVGLFNRNVSVGVDLQMSSGMDV